MQVLKVTGRCDLNEFLYYCFFPWTFLARAPKVYYLWPEILNKRFVRRGTSLRGSEFEKDPVRDGRP
jgi:hypothetical protein